MVLVSLAADQLSAPTSTASAVSPEPSGPGLKQFHSNLEPSNSVHPSQTVNDGIKDGTDGGTHRLKPSHSSRSSPLHTDTLSVFTAESCGSALAGSGQPVFRKAVPESSYCS